MNEMEREGIEVLRGAEKRALRVHRTEEEDPVEGRPGDLDSAGERIVSRDLVARGGRLRSTSFRRARPLEEEDADGTEMRAAQAAACLIESSEGCLDIVTPVSSGEVGEQQQLVCRI
ncbi:MAG TPA: hypothetical protein PKX99_10190, partial [Thermoanaerobaculia bacterium]|nr:hypothetical protein [Thermoanaerobaculia bacterium]